MGCAASRHQPDAAQLFMSSGGRTADVASTPTTTVAAIGTNSRDRESAPFMTQAQKDTDIDTAAARSSSLSAPPPSSPSSPSPYLASPGLHSTSSLPLAASPSSPNSSRNSNKKEVFKPPSLAVDSVKNSPRSPVRSPVRSPGRKKSTYVPPSPITETVASVDFDFKPQEDQDENRENQVPHNVRQSTREKAETDTQPSTATATPKTSTRSAAASPAAARRQKAKIQGLNPSKEDRVGDDGSLASLDFEGEAFPPASEIAAASASATSFPLGGGPGGNSRLLVDDEDFKIIVDEAQQNLEEEESLPSVSQNMETMDPPGRVQYVSPDVTPEPSSESGMRFDELYRLKGVLGTGAFSTVREGFHRSNTGMSYAVKCINRKKLSEEDEAALLDEVGILKEMKHVHIIRLYDFFVEPSTYYLVMERMRGGELFDRIVAKAYYNEKEARDTCKIILEAVRYCHHNHVAHRDLKPENLLLLAEDDDTSVKIADFGFAKRVLSPNSLKTQCGTPGYVAPEILEGTPYDERADMWSVGVILYILLGGYPPFIESTQRDLFRKIRKGDYEFHEEYWGTVSTEAKDLISSLLTVDSNNRLTAQDALVNAWIMGDDAKLAQKDLGANLDKLRNFNAKRKFRAAVSTVMAVKRLHSLSTTFFRDIKES